MSESRDHAELGGSSASRWMNCPGSVFLNRTLPPQEESEAAKLGTEVHSVCEQKLKMFLDERELGYSNIHIYFGEHDELAEGYVNHVWEKILLKSITQKAYGIEEQFVLHESLKMSGYIDFWAVYIDDRGKRVGVVVDYKNGYHSVAVENNSQLAFYACALLAELRKGGKGLDYVRAVIYQPNDGTGNPYRETKFTAKQLEKWEEKFIKAAEIIYVEQKQKFKVGSWCRFCRAQAQCPKYSKELSKKTALKLVNPEEIKLRPPETIPDNILSQLILYADRIEDYIGACKKYAIERAKAGKPLPGIKAVQGVSRRKWKDATEEIITHFSARYGLDVTEKKLLALTTVEKMMNKISDKETSTQIINQFVDMTNPPIVLVPDTDPRPAISATKDKFETYEIEGK